MTPTNSRVKTSEYSTINTEGQLSAVPREWKPPDKPTISTEVEWMGQNET